jgi:thioredoxin reductase
MTDYAYDLLVLGAGSGGLATSKRAASYGARVAIIENDRVGGTCVIRGCVPKKLMVYAAEFAHAFGDAAGYGWHAETPALDWPKLVAARDANVAGLEATHKRLLTEAGVELITGTARITSPHEVDVDGRRLTAATILVATGSHPAVPPIEGIDHVITSDGFFELKEQPSEVAVIGAGYIACELAGVFQALGTKVHLIYRGELPLRGFDCDLRNELDSALRASGMQVHARTSVKRISKGEHGFTLDLAGPDGDCQLTVECCMLYATGRTPNTKGLGLEDVGVALDETGAVVCGEDATTAVPSIVAVGDVTGRSPLGRPRLRRQVGHDELREHPDRRFHRPADRNRRHGRGRGQARVRRRGGHRFPRALQADASQPDRPRPEDARQARRPQGGRPRPRLPRARQGCPRDHPGLRRRREDGRHEGRLRRHGRNPSVDGRRARDAALKKRKALPRAASAGCAASAARTSE